MCADGHGCAPELSAWKLRGILCRITAQPVTTRRRSAVHEWTGTGVGRAAQKQVGEQLRYRATITCASLRLRESRLIADLLLQGVSPQEWQDAILERNVLQVKNPDSARRIARLVRARLEPLGDGLWTMVRDGSRDLATQAAFAGAVQDSRLLGDFMDITLRDERALFATTLEMRMWNDYVAGCRGRDPEMPHWTDATVARLRSAVFSMLAEAGYLKDTKSLLLQNVFIDKELASYLRDRGESYVLRCMEVAE